MNEEFKTKIKKDLTKAGFYSEIQAIRSFTNQGWDCSGGYNYFDRDENKMREIDIYAGMIRTDLIDKLGYSPYIFVGEVKKTEKPWIVFKQTDFQFIMDNPFNFVTYRNLSLTDREIHQILWENSLAATLDWSGYGIHEAFKSPNQPSRWHSAFVSVVKCAYEIWTNFQDFYKKSDEPWFCWIKPIVILDGNLAAVELDSNGEMSISEIECAPFCHSFRTKNYYLEGRFFSGFSIDIVTMNYLETYLELSQECFKKVGQLL